MQRTFSGDIAGLEIGAKFEVVTQAGRRPHRDTASLAQYVVVRREEHRVTAEPTVISIDEDRLMFTTYTHTDDAPLARIG